MSPKKTLDLLNDYIGLVSSGIKDMIITTRGKSRLSTSVGVASAVRCIREAARRGNKLIFIGNGGSACIASHQAIDFWKNGRIKAVSFNDAALLTCISNDFAYESVFEKPVEMFAEAGDILLAISSSGRSKNIINAAKMACKKRLKVITLSGFDAGNALRRYGDINFYIPSHSYGVVEISHLAICHCMLDHIIGD